MRPLLDSNGVDLLLPRDAGIGAERVTPADPRYQELRDLAIDLTVAPDPAADAVLLAELEARYRQHHAA